MPRLHRLLIQLLLLIAMAEGLLTVALQMADAGLGCPLGVDCAGDLSAQRSLMKEVVPGLSLARHVGTFVLLGLSLLLALLRVFIPQRQDGIWPSLLIALILISLSLAFQLQAVALPVLGVLDDWSNWLLIALFSGALVRPFEGAEAPSKGLRNTARLLIALLLMTVYLGVWVRVSGAGLACPDFPTCGGVKIPEASTFTALPELFKLQPDARQLLKPEVQVMLLWLHRLLGLMLLAVSGALGLVLMGRPSGSVLSRTGVWIQGLVFFQVAVALLLGPAQLPVILGVIHTGLAMLLLLKLNQILWRSPPGSPEEAALPEPKTRPLAPAPRAPERLGDRIGRTRGGLVGLFRGRQTLARSDLETLEAQLLMADLGVKLTSLLIDQLSQQLDERTLKDAEEIKAALRQRLAEVIEPVSQPLRIPDEVRPFVILVVGVNGVGKTTTIGKLASRFQREGLKVMLAAGDTFRAAAVEQLQAWGERHDVPVVAQHTGADSASVIFDALEAAKARNIDVLIADTAGRLHTKSNLMEELSKIKRIMARIDPEAPHETLLVLDAGTGQNAINQAREFHQAVGLTGLALTKLDGTAKGGVLFALAREFSVPIRFIGVGESAEDLRDFNAKEFIEALFDEPESALASEAEASTLI